MFSKYRQEYYNSNDAITIFNAAVHAVQPAQLVQQHISVANDSINICDAIIPKTSFNRLFIIGAGKASAAMAVEAEKILGELLAGGIVTTKYHHALASERIEIIEAAHPVPDEQSMKAVEETLNLLTNVTEADIVLCLLSGGASALWCDVPPGISLYEARVAFDLLVKSGANIHEINTVRKHLSNIKGGQLVKHCQGAQVFSLMISDVAGDDPDVIASGPTVADPTTFNDAYRTLSSYHLLPHLPSAVTQHIQNGLQHVIPETPKPGDTVFARTTNKIIGNNRTALIAAAQKATALGYTVYLHQETVTGNTVTEAKKFAELVVSYRGEKPACFLRGGETTLRVNGSGKGGRNQHFVLTALYALIQIHKQQDLPAFTILSGGTDGTDGPTDAAGAMIDNRTIDFVLHHNLSPNTYLSNFDAYHFFQKTDNLIVTGATQTNVMDIMIALIH